MRLSQLSGTLLPYFLKFRCLGRKTMCKSGVKMDSIRKLWFLPETQLLRQSKFQRQIRCRKRQWQLRRKPVLELTRVRQLLRVCMECFRKLLLRRDLLAEVVIQSILWKQTSVVECGLVSDVSGSQSGVYCKKSGQRKCWDWYRWGKKAYWCAWSFEKKKSGVWEFNTSDVFEWGSA